jgi:hypothetical protein
MTPSAVIESYVNDVMRRARVRDRQDLGLELRNLLGEMLADRAEAAGKPADDAMVLAMLREFGTPAEVALRYGPPSFVIIPPEQSRSFATLSVLGVLLQWLLTIPSAEHLTAWWFTWGLGAFWWPGLLSMFALIGSTAKMYGLVGTKWSPRSVDPERVNRGLLGLGLAWFVIGVAFMVALPWIVTQLPVHLATAFAFSPGFLANRAPPVLVLWLGQFATLTYTMVQGRQSAFTQRLEAAFSLGFLLLIGWWLSGDIFAQPLADDGAHLALGFVLAIIAIDLAVKLVRQRNRLPASAGQQTP